MHNYFDYSPEIEQAIGDRQPILALESTILTHGLPYPENLNTAYHLENIVRKLGAVPATIAVMDGQLKIGLTEYELERLVSEKNVVKVSRRDLPFAVSQKLTAGTTVAATVFAAYNAGIRVLATGGIGGVHRGNEFDISADLLELSRNPIAVVCSGAKAILDIPKTLEYLETFSVPVIGYRTSVFPAFYTAKTNNKIPSVASLEELIKLLEAHRALDSLASVLIANPIPNENELSSEEVEPAIMEALAQAEEQSINGKAITPFLLQALTAATAGKSLQANLKLIESNVRLGAKIAANL